MRSPLHRFASRTTLLEAALDEPAALKRWNRLQDEARRYAKNSAEALAAPFAEPEGGCGSGIGMLTWR